MMKRLAVLLFVPALLASCSTLRDTLGVDKAAPDEFAVVERAPLTMPPDFNLTPPRPGAPRPQETHTTDQAQDLVIGTNQPVAASTASSSEAALLSQAGASNAAPDIRKELSGPDDEQSNDGTVAQRLGLADGEAGKALDPDKELKRLKKENIKAPAVPDKPVAADKAKKK